MRKSGWAPGVASCFARGIWESPQGNCGDPELFKSLMQLLSQEIPRHDFGLSLKRIKEHNLELDYQESLIKSKNNEDRAMAATKRRMEEKKYEMLLLLKKITNLLVLITLKLS